MIGSLRIVVVNYNTKFILMQQLGRNLSGHYPTKQATVFRHYFKCLKV